MGNGSTIKELRQWFRSTKAHNTMTLGDGNIQYTLGKRVEVANSSHEVICNCKIQAMIILLIVVLYSLSIRMKAILFFVW